MGRIFALSTEHHIVHIPANTQCVASVVQPSSCSLQSQYSCPTTLGTDGRVGSGMPLACRGPAGARCARTPGWRPCCTRVPPLSLPWGTRDQGDVTGEALVFACLRYVKIGLFVLVEMMLLLIWNTTNPLVFVRNTKLRDPVTNYPDMSLGRCEVRDRLGPGAWVFIGLLVAYNVSLLLFGLLMAFKARHITAQFSDGITLCHVTARHITSHHVTSRRITSHRVRLAYSEYNA